MASHSPLWTGVAFIVSIGGLQFQDSSRTKSQRTLAHFAWRAAASNTDAASKCSGAGDTNVNSAAAGTATATAASAAASAAAGAAANRASRVGGAGVEPLDIYIYKSIT